MCRCFPQNGSIYSNFFLTSPLECSSYKWLNDSNRAETYENRAIALCESSILTGWYRFGGPAGYQMPESCIPTWRCATHAPGWLNGNHPSKDDGIVQRRVCYHWNNNCCRWSNNIHIRNCGNFYVYRLRGSPTCRLRYCANGLPG